jgi:hypothetical protein
MHTKSKQQSYQRLLALVSSLLQFWKGINLIPRYPCDTFTAPEESLFTIPTTSAMSVVDKKRNASDLHCKSLTILLC